MEEESAVEERRERVNGIVPSSFYLPYVILNRLFQQSQHCDPKGEAKLMSSQFQIQVHHMARALPDLFIPVIVRDLLQRREHEVPRVQAILVMIQYDLREVSVIPKLQHTLRNLPMNAKRSKDKELLAQKTLAKTREQGTNHRRHLLSIHSLHDLLDLVDEEQLVLRVAPRPIVQNPPNDLFVSHRIESHQRRQIPVLRDIEQQAAGQRGGKIDQPVETVQRQETVL